MNGLDAHADHLCVLRDRNHRGNKLQLLLGESIGLLGHLDDHWHFDFDDNWFLFPVELFVDVEHA